MDYRPIVRPAPLPSLVLFLAVGLGAASTVGFTDYELARTIGIVALALILFDGGLGSSYGELRSVLRPAVTLATAGTVMTALVAGVAAKELFAVWGLIVGSIVASTDGTAVFSLLRGSVLPRRLERTLEAEAGLNDPVALLLVVGFIDWIQKPGYGLTDMAWLFVRELSVGTACGVAVGIAGTALFTRARLPAAGGGRDAAPADAATRCGVARRRVRTRGGGARLRRTPRTRLGVGRLRWATIPRGAEPRRTTRTRLGVVRLRWTPAIPNGGGAPRATPAPQRERFVAASDGAAPTAPAQSSTCHGST